MRQREPAASLRFAQDEDSKIQHGVARSKLCMFLIMQPFSQSMRAIGGFAVLAISAMNILAAGNEGDAANGGRKGAVLNCGARIECMTSDGTQKDTHAPVRVMNDDSINCPLNEGDTTFVVTLPRAGSLERLKFVSDNVAARGTLKIAVSNEELAPDSARWQPVDGSVAFHRKRLFDVSVVGLDAKFVRVTFNVERDMQAGEFTLASGGFESAGRVLFGVGPGVAKQTVFGVKLTLPSPAPLIASGH
jgi:hypothetical protein